MTINMIGFAVGLGLLLAAGEVLPTLAADPAKPDKLWVYFGTYTGKKSKGIYRSELDLATGKLSTPVLAGEAVNPSFLAIHPSGRFLYAVGEVAKFKSESAGGVVA